MEKEETLKRLYVCSDNRYSEDKFDWNLDDIEETIVERILNKCITQDNNEEMVISQRELLKIKRKLSNQQSKLNKMGEYEKIIDSFEFGNAIDWMQSGVMFQGEYKDILTSLTKLRNIKEEE